jgi:hypothetical protein
MNNLDWEVVRPIPKDWVRVTAQQLEQILARENYTRGMDGRDITYERRSNGERIAIERTENRSALSGEGWVHPSLVQSGSSV